VFTPKHFITLAGNKVGRHVSKYSEENIYQFVKPIDKYCTVGKYAGRGSVPRD
jgi:hypothetical protein